MASEGTQELRSTECLCAAPWPGRRPERRRSCQSGSPPRWQRSGGGIGTGMSGILKPLAGKTISCSMPSATLYAYVDESGMPFTRAIYMGSDSGWKPGFSAAVGWGNYASAIWGLDGLNGQLVQIGNGATDSCGPVRWPST